MTCCTVLASAGMGACGGSPGGEGSGATGARVTRVIDGDTVEMERLGMVRLIGIDTPEENRCGESAATQFTRDRLEGQVVRYELGVEPKDRYDRTLAYVSREGRMHNLALLSEGYARVLTIPPNDKYASRFERAERGTRTAQAGSLQACDRSRRPGRPAGEEFSPAPEEDSGGGGGSGGGRCLRSSACPGKRDGDGDGCYCE